MIRYLWLLLESCKNNIFTSLSILRLVSLSLFPSQTGFSCHLFLVRFLTFGCLASAYQQYTQNICFVQCRLSNIKCRWESSFKWVPSISVRVCLHQLFSSWSSGRAKKKRGLSWALHYFLTKVSTSLPKLFLLFLGAKHRMMLIYHRIISL